MDIRHLKIVREGNKITVEGLKGVIYVRGKSSYRVQLSLGKNAKGKYDVKRETIQGSIKSISVCKIPRLDELSVLG